MPEKKYLIEIPGQEGVAYWGATRFDANKDQLLKDHPNAIIAEIDSYAAEDANDNDSYIISIGESGEPAFWDSKRFNANKEQLLKDHPDVKVQRVRDYHFGQAQNLASEIEKKEGELAEWGKSAYTLDENVSALNKGYRSQGERNEERKARIAEIEDLKAQYDANPSVIAQREAIKEARSEYVQGLNAEAAAIVKENSTLDVVGEKLRRQEVRMNMLDGQFGSIKSNVGPSAVTEAKTAAYDMAGAAQRLLDHAAEIRNKELGFWKGMSDVAKNDFLDVVNQPEGKTYMQVAGILKKLNDKVGNLNENITPEAIDENLTREEALLLRSYFELMDAQEKVGTGWGYKAGEIAGESIKFALEFLALGGFADSATQGMLRGMRAGLTKWVRKGIQAGGKALGRKLIKGAADIATRGAAKAAIMTAFRPSAYEGMAEMMTKIDEEGNINLGKNAALGLLDQYIETVSEMSGDLIGKTLGVMVPKGAKKWTKAMWHNAFGNTKFGQWGQAIANSQFKQYLRNAGFHGMPLEMMEEYVGNSLRMIYDKESLSNMHQDGNFKAMLLGFLPMSLIGAVGGVANYAAVNKENAQLAEKVNQLVLGKNIDKKRADFLTDRNREMSPIEMGQLHTELSDILGKDASEEDKKLISDYITSLAEYQVLRGAQTLKERDEYGREMADLESQYGKIEVDGNVTAAETKDGKQVYITSSKNPVTGEFGAVDMKTGKHLTLRETDIKEEKQEDGSMKKLSRTLPTNDFLEERVIEKKSLAEQERMSIEKAQQIAEIAELLPERLNLGTDGNPIMMPVKEKSNNGVIVVDEEGNEKLLSWDEVGRIMGMPIKVATDQELLDAEIETVAAGRAANRAKYSSTKESQQKVEGELSEIAQEVESLNPAPEAAYTNEAGEVDEVSFWENDPEGWCDWNDRQKQDNGIDSRKQIEQGIAALSRKSEEAVKAMKTDNPVQRKQAENALNAAQDKIRRLQAIEEKYEQANAEKEDVRAEKILQLRERANYWRKKFGLDSTKLRVYESIDEVTDEGAKRAIAKGKTPGWASTFSKATAHAALYLPMIDSIEELDETVMHEVVTHYGLATWLGKQEYNDLMDKVWDMMSDNSRATFYNYYGVVNKTGDARRRAAAEEYVAHVAEKIDAENATAGERRFWQRIIDAIIDFFSGDKARLRSATIAKAVKDSYNVLVNKAAAAEMQKAQANTETVNNTAIQEAENAKAEAPESVTNISEAAQNDSGFMPSIQTEGYVVDMIRGYVKTKEGKKAGWTEDKIETIIEETQSLINAIHNASTGNEFYDEFAKKDPTIRVDWRDGMPKPIVTWTRANIEYKYDMSADLLCINNEGLEEVLSSDQMVSLMEMFEVAKVDAEKEFKNIKGKKKPLKVDIRFTSEDYLELYNTLKDLGFVVPCKGCFDAAGRFKMLPSVAQKFAEVVNAVIDERNTNPEAFDAIVKSKAGASATIEGLPTSASNKLDAIRVAVAGDKLTEHVKWSQLMSADGQTKMLSDWGGVFRAWQRTGAGRPKDKLLPEPYYGDIVSSHTTIIGKYGEKTPSFRDIDVNQGTGLRRNSHSEFRPVLAVDEIQFMRDAFIKGLTVFKYMKELDDVRLFGKLGVKYNMSYFPAFVPGTNAAGLDVNGNYVASEESVGAREFPYVGEDGKTHYDGNKGMLEAQKYVNKDVSMSSVVFSIPHLIKCLTDVPTASDMRGIWGSLIPFHSSGATSGSLAAQGLGKARANGVGHGFEEAMTRYNEGVTNFEDVQNDRFDKGWVIIEGKKAGTAVEEGHKLEFANGTHYYNKERGIHLFKSSYILDSELPEGALNEDGTLNLSAEEKKAVEHKYSIDYNDKVRELKGPAAYQDAADYYLQFLPSIGLKPRFDFEVDETTFLQMCEDANVDPMHPKLGWKGKGNGWNPIDSEAYYSLFCDYGMTDPTTGEWAPHNPVGIMNENGEREFRMPENTVEIVKEGLERYSNIRRAEQAKIDTAIREFAQRSVAKGRVSQEAVDSVLGKEDDIMLKTEISPRTSITPEMDAEYMAAVEAGDMEAAQGMVLEAARLAMPNTKVVDENGNPKVVYHGTGSEFYAFRNTNDSNELGAGYYFSDSYEMAERYATDETLADNRFRAEDLAFEIFTEEMGHSEEEYDYVNEETEDDYNEAYYQAVERLFGNGHVKSVFLNIENPFIVGSRSEDLPYRSLWQQTNEAHRVNDGIIDPEFTLRHETLSGNQYVAFKPSQIKSADPVTYDDAGNVIPLSERFNEEKEDIRFKTRTDSQREKLFADAKAEFGLTDNFNVAGYMLPDGSLLNFGDPANPTTRAEDHRAIEGVIMDNGTEYDSRWMYLADFMNEGAIRLLPEYAGINLMKAPTKEQRQRLMDFIYKYNGEVILEIADDRLNNAAYVEYDRRTSPARIFRDIDGYFNEGIVPQSNTMFKTANNNQAIFVSNAAKAVEGIKMEKATPEQWLKMIEKNGGLKAGEDKWMGLSDWLKASDKKTLTKQEVLDFINENMIQIEEVHYGINAEDDAERAHGEISERLQDKFDNYVDEYYQDHDWEDGETDNAREYAIEKLREEMGDTFPYTIEIEHGSVYLTFPYEEEDDLVKWAEKTGVKYTSGVSPINDTRLNYTTDGLSNKHEIALTVPTIERWGQHDDVHFGDAGDGRAVAWIRFGDASKWVPEQREDGKKGRTKKVLVIDEIQSKRHQEGREKGYKSEFKNSKKAQRLKAEVDRVTARLLELEKDRRENSEAEQTELARLDFLLNEAQSNAEYDAIIEERDKITAHIENRESEIFSVRKERRELAYQLDKQIDRDAVDALSAIPDAPFEKNWQELAMKRMLRYAAENGYDVVAWTKGDQQADRYNIGGIVKDIDVADVTKGRFVYLSMNDGNIIKFIVNSEGTVIDGNSDYKGKQLADIVGKELSLRILNAENGTTLSGDDLRIGGEGMKGFYDRMLPAFMNKYGKKWGVKVEDIHLNLEGGLDMHSVPVTEEMKESVMEGQTMFKTRQPNQSSEEFCLDCMRDYVRKYGYVTIIKVEPVNDATAKKYGYTLDELKELSGLYDKRIVVIFAKEDITDSDEVESTIFHESIHHLAKRYKSLIDTGKLFWNLADRTEELAKIREYVEKNYPDNSQEGKYEEMLCFTMEFYAGTTGLDFIVDQLRGQSKKDVELIINKTNYGRSEQTEAVRQDTTPREDGADNDRQNGREGEGASNEAGEAQQGEVRFKTGITPEVRQEMAVISAQAIVNGNYMKAPNGKDSKLTPDQWAMVRTKNFLNWAGDWMNDPENASVVLDVETREPLVLYHGTPRAGFTEFKSGWFTTSKEDAISYSGDRKGRMFDPNEKYEPETLSAGDFRLGYMTFDSEEDRAVFIAEHPTAESAMSESEYENARIQAEDEEYDTLTERKPELQKIWDAYREYERDHFVDTTIGEILNNPDAYTEDDLRRAVLAYDSNAVFDSIDELETTEERKSALVESLNYMNEDAKENGAEGILDMVVATRVPRNGEGVKHNDLGNRTYEVYARIERPYEIDANGRGSEFESGDIYQSVKDALADEQYDGVIIRNWRVGRHQQLGDVVVPKYGGNQVKLTSNENPTESEDIRFRFIGEKGAANIDKATQQTWMLDSLKRAQQMESKFDAKTIKRATGWEKGVDGKWRYEEPDNITLKEDKVQELYDNYEFNKRKVNSGEAGDWKEESCLLPELIDAPELFRAYPELKKCRVRLTDRGFGTSWGGTIDLNYGFFASSAGRYGYKSIKGVLLHELQHEIQEIEGFARGGNIDTADQIKRNAAVWAWKLRAEEVAKEHPEFKKSDVKEFLEDEFEGIGQYDWRANKGAFDEGTRIYTLGLSGGKTLAKDYKLLASIDESDYETYYRLAGEVEARNVTDRAKMSYAERKYRLASETEDRDRDLQIVRGVTPDEATMFKTRTKPAPTKTQDVYKLMRLGADGKLYPLFIGSAEPIELGTWYDAESPNLGDLTKLASGVHLVNNETGEAMTLDEFKAQHPEINIKGKRPNVAAINWATENGARWIEIEDKATAQRRYEGESRSYYNLGINGSGQVGQFAMRPGWHAGSLPTMRQIGKGKDKNLRDDSFVWVKGRIPADVDYQSEADANPDKDIPTHIPTDGFYMKATNANAKASQADKMGWYVAGSFIADEIISDAEARRVIDSWNAEHPDAKVEYDYPRESGREFDPERGGLVEKENIMFKTTHERALRGLVTLESSGASFDAVQQIIKNRLASIQKQVAKLNKLPDSEHVQKRIAALQEEFEIAERQELMLNETASKLIDETLVEPDYESALSDMTPRNADEAIAQALTMSVDAATRKKVGIMLAPESLANELGWSKDDWKGLSYIVSDKGISIDRLAEMLGEDSELEHIFSGMDTMDIKDAIIDFLMGMMTYADIRDYTKNARMKEAKDEAEAINAQILSKSESTRNGLSVEEYNSWMIEADRKDRRDELNTVSALAADINEVAEQITDSTKDKADAAKATLMDKIRSIDKAIATLRSIMSVQKEYDKGTVKAIVDVANELLTSGALDGLTRGKVKKLLSIINGGAGRENMTITANRLIDLVIDNRLSFLGGLVDKFMKARIKKVNSSGVEIRGEVDAETQKVMDAFRRGMKMTETELEDAILAEMDKMSSPSETIRDNAAYELSGLQFAKRYNDEVRASVAEEAALLQEIKDTKEAHKTGLGFDSDEEHRTWEDAVRHSVRENKMERISALQKLVEDLSKIYTGGVENAKLLKQEDRARIQQIQHYANSDMQGMPASEHEIPNKALWNNSLTRFFLAPLATFDQMLRQFGKLSPSGEGYLWNHFMRKWLTSTEKEYKGVQAAHDVLDSQARAMFGGKVRRWSDLFAMSRKTSPIKAKFWDGGEMKEHVMTVGNLLYIYMVNKMTDGKTKLRKMGISEQDVVDIAASIDPQLIALADWIQETFLPGIRDKYNAVHEKLFGAPMAAIENYFPLKVNPRARTREVDTGVAETEAKPSTITGSIIKRTRNSLALDVMNVDAIDLVLEHIQQMEHWAAFAEFNQDLNALLSYRKFRTRVENMSGIYGSGTKAWQAFRHAAEMAAGVYQPASQKSTLDKAAVNIAKGVTGAKISFRVYTALKQLLSMPAFISDARIDILAKNLATPWVAWNWCMENLPLFEKRWKSRQAGDSRLMATESDWSVWKNNIVETAGRLGMSPNAFVDAFTVAVGARSIYETRKKQYLETGYSESAAEERAKQDATILFNESQQSNESAFLATVQVDRTVASVMFTVFRNSSMGYQRMYADAIRNLKHKLTKGNKAQSIEFIKKQLIRDGIEDSQAERAAERIYGRSFFKDAMRVATFGFVAQFAWNLGAYLPYLLVGDDDDEKKSMIKDAVIHGLIGGPVEGLSAGSIISEVGNMIAQGGDFKNYNPTLLPIVSDAKKVIQMFNYDEVAAVNEVFNLLIQAGLGVNPQTLTDAGVAIYDACNGDLELSKEVTLALMRILQAPQSQVDKMLADEINFKEDRGLDMTISEFAERYAKYKVLRGAPVTGWMYGDEKEKEREDKYIARFLKDAEEYKRTRGNEEAKKYYEYLDTEYKEVTETLNELKSNIKKEAMQGNEVNSLEYAKLLTEFTESDIFKRYTQFGSKAKAIEKMRDKMKKVDSYTRTSIEDAMLDLRRQMVEEMDAASQAKD